MVDEKLFDYQQYIQERLKEIDNLDERRYAKRILLDGLANIFALSEQRYQQLEQRICQELEIPWNCYEIITTVTHRKQYDPIHETLFPVCQEDVGSNEKQRAHTVYLAADDAACKELLREGTVKGIAGGKEVFYKISCSRRYEAALERLYRLFLANKIPWNTVHTGHLERFFDLEPLEGPQEVVADIAFQWGKWEPNIYEAMVPLWNVRESELKAYKFAMPCMDGICYEHTFTVEDKGEGTFLVDSSADIMEIRYEQNKVILKSDSDTLKEVKMYQICGGAGTDISGQPYFPSLTNRKNDSFAGRYLYKTGNFIQTEAELFRKIEELSGNYEVSLVRYEIKETVKMPVLHADMNYFIGESVFPREQRKQLVLYFKSGTGYLCQAHIRYLLSQLQLEYIEYKCIGIIEQG